MYRKPDDRRIDSDACLPLQVHDIMSALFSYDCIPSVCYHISRPHHARFQQSLYSHVQLSDHWLRFTQASDIGCLVDTVVLLQ